MAERIPDLLSKRCCVYTLLDADERPLYIGLSTRAMVRTLGQHNRKPWWTLVASARFEHFDDLWVGRSRESELIREHCPPHNSNFVPSGEVAA